MSTALTAPHTFKYFNPRSDAQAPHIAAIEAELEGRRAEINAVLPDESQRNLFISTMFYAIRDQWDLITAWPDTIVDCAIIAAQLGLQVGKATGQMWIIARNDKNRPGKKVASPQKGSRGLVQLLMEHPSVKGIFPYVVREGDDFRQNGDGSLFHEINVRNGKGDIYAAYVRVFMEGISNPVYYLATRAQIDRSRAHSQSADFWDKHEEEMAKRTPLILCAKWLPMRPVIARLFKEIEIAELGGDVDTSAQPYTAYTHESAPTPPPVSSNPELPPPAANPLAALKTSFANEVARRIGAKEVIIPEANLAVFRTATIAAQTEAELHAAYEAATGFAYTDLVGENLDKAVDALGGGDNV